MAALQRKRRATNVTEEPCTLVYTLINPCDLKFDDFCLIVRSLHTYMVEDIVPYPESNCVHVKLGYQASTANAIKKLGPMLPQYIAINKLSTYVKESELLTLDCLKKRFGFGAEAINDDCEIQPPTTLPPPAKRRPQQKYKFAAGPSTQDQEQEYQ